MAKNVQEGERLKSGSRFLNTSCSSDLPKLSLRLRVETLHPRHCGKKSVRSIVLAKLVSFTPLSLATWEKQIFLYTKYDFFKYHCTFKYAMKTQFSKHLLILLLFDILLQKTNLCETLFKIISHQTCFCTGYFAPGTTSSCPPDLQSFLCG